MIYGFFMDDFMVFFMVFFTPSAQILRSFSRVGPLTYAAAAKKPKSLGFRVLGYAAAA